MRTLIIAVLALCGLATPAAADPGSASTLVFTVYDGTDTSWPVLTEVTLKCEPTGGTHAAAEDACDLLTAVDGDLETLQPLGVACPQVYQPVTVEVGGNWRDKVVTFEHDYPNLCVAFDQSGGLFRF